MAETPQITHMMNIAVFNRGDAVSLVLSGGVDVSLTFVPQLGQKLVCSFSSSWPHLGQNMLITPFIALYYALPVFKL